MLDPDAQAMRDAMLALNAPPLESMSPTAARSLLAAGRARAAISGPDLFEVRDLAAENLRLRLYRPAPGALTVVLFLHGGGWVLGDLESHDALCRYLARSSGAAVVAVDYRLAPEHPFPAAVEDAETALRWLTAQGAALDLDVERLALMGDSAGGNLATVLALMARGTALAQPRLQVLAYPVTEVTLDQPSHSLSGPGWALNGAAMRWFRDHYLQDGVADWRAAPLRADPSGSAPALILTAGADPLADEGITYASHLARHGVRVEHRHYPGQMHGFLTAGLTTATAQTEIRRIGAAITRELALDPVSHR